VERSDPTIHAGPAPAPRAPHALCVDLLAIKANKRVELDVAGSARSPGHVDHAGVDTDDGARAELSVECFDLVGLLVVQSTVSAMII
jgi:hypothetical protein